LKVRESTTRATNHRDLCNSRACTPKHCSLLDSFHSELHLLFSSTTRLVIFATDSLDRRDSIITPRLDDSTAQCMCMHIQSPIHPPLIRRSCFLKVSDNRELVASKWQAIDCIVSIPLIIPKSRRNGCQHVPLHLSQCPCMTLAHAIAFNISVSTAPALPPAWFFFFHPLQMPPYCLQDCHYFFRTALRGLSISTTVSPLYT
jgi:hypothetical protein